MRKEPNVGLIRYEKGDRRYLHFWDIIEKIRPSNILEIGVAAGSSARIILMRASEYSNNVKFWGIDLFEDLTKEEVVKVSRHHDPKKYLWPDDMRVVKERLDKFDAEVNLIKGNSRKVLPELDLPKMDLIFIDGDHRVEGIRADWKNVKRLIHDETVIVFDDYWPNRKSRTHGAKRIIEEIEEGGDYNVEILEPGDTYTHNDFIKINFVKVTKK